MEYYKNQCKECEADCDGEFCSYECQEAYESGLGDYLYEVEKDKQLIGDVYYG